MDRRVRITLGVLLVIAAALRLWGISFGLPYLYHQDEPIVVNHALAYGTGDLNPHFFIIPPLTSYLAFVLYAAYFLLLQLAGAVKGSEEFALQFFRDPTPFYLIGRIALGVLPSIASVWLTFVLGRRFFSLGAALYAAAVMAVSFLNVTNAHYLYTDNLLVFFVLCAYGALARALVANKPQALIVAACCIGIAMATKYNAAILIVPFCITYVFLRRTSGRAPLGGDLVLYAVIISISFFVCNPFSIFDIRFFLGSVSTRIWHVYTGLTHHIRYSLFAGAGIAPVLGGVAGLAIVAWKRRIVGAILISFPIVFYLHLILASQPFARYALVLIPFLALGAGFLLFDYARTFTTTRWKNILRLIIAVSILVPTMVKSIVADRLFARTDTRTTAAAWIKAQVPPGSRIALDSAFFCPRLQQTHAQLQEKSEILSKQPELTMAKGKKLAFQMRAADGKKEYETYYITGPHETTGQFLQLWPTVDSTLGALRVRGIAYVVISNTAISEDFRSLQREIMRVGTLSARFSPYNDNAFRPSYDTIETTCMPVDARELFSRRYNGPAIEIYRIE